ncbi:uncharacterized protein znhit6 [Clarias gariepinus]|uniref:uncharacterized protein znhit6 n=1 Tax=Clarias gariepinus TaxID=13013 RepID=UPI00234D5D17|nr:uncharacterized protein znhit6 [Clarias gariepinus]
MRDVAAVLHKQLDMDAEKDGRRALKRKISTTSCDVCEAEEAKYRCPSCQKCSCSLPCVKQHKLQSGCSGVRDRTAFVALSRFSDLDLLSDYRFLEETGRIADGPNRDTLLHTPSHHSYSAKLLLRNARAAKVTLKLLPKSFSRRRENTSFYNKTEKKLYWYLKLFFPHSNAKYSARVPEDQVLEKILSHYIHPTESDPVKRQNLKMYVDTPIDRLSVFMKSEQRLPNSLKYHELDLKKTLRENLMFKTVVEYPELHVVVKERRCEEYCARIPDRSIISTRPSCSSEALGALESRTARPENETAAQSDLEEGEIRSEEEEKDDQNTARSVSCAVFKNNEYVSTSVDQNLTRKSDDASSPPRSLNKYDDDQHTAASECLFPPSSSDKDVKDGINSPALHDADCLPPCPDDVTKHTNGLMEVDAAHLLDENCGDGRTSIDQNLTKRLNESSPQRTLNECDDGDIKNTASSGCLPHSHSKNIDVEGDLESPAVQDAMCLSSCTDVTKENSDSMEVACASLSLPADDGGSNEGSPSIDQNPKFK